MSQSATILRVAIRSPLRRLFDYLIDPAADTVWQPGMRVRVPFGRRETVGVVVALADQSDCPKDKLKMVGVAVDDLPLLAPDIMQLYAWTSRYYQHPMGDVVLGTLPKCLRQGRACPDAFPAEDRAVTSHALSLNADQQYAVDTIRQSGDQFQVFCLEGVTGSGKTEVYLQAMASRLARGEQVLVLVPEIALTPQTVARFQSRFAVSVVCLHSELTDKQRLTAWAQAAAGEAAIVIGTRSAVFVPCPRLAMVIIDESHDASFKQQSGFRYSARDVAMRRAQQAGIPLILGSATPSLETRHNQQRPHVTWLTLPQRVNDIQPPEMRCIDIRGESLQGGLSQALIDHIASQLQRGGQVLLFLNRRGYAPVWMCHHCRWVALCPSCDARMTLHKRPNRLICHHCTRQSKPPVICPSCQQCDLSDVGVGTEQLEEVLAQRFPDERILRIDRDSTRKKGSLQSMLDAIHRGEARILIGTQMLSKGHHFANLTMAAIIDADTGLYSTDFRAAERMGQLLVQVAGRAGREMPGGEVHIQTRHPDHPQLRCLLAKGYAAFSEALMAERQSTQWPPFTHLALLRAEATQSAQPQQFLEKVKRQCGGVPAEVLGPVPAPMARRAGRYRAQLLIQSPSRQQRHQTLQHLLGVIERMTGHRGVRWSLDVDPQDML